MLRRVKVFHNLTLQVYERGEKTLIHEEWCLLGCYAVWLL
jgi:hypothetical protein